MTDANSKSSPGSSVSGTARGASEGTRTTGWRASVRFVVVFVVLIALFYVPYSFISQTEAYAGSYLSLIARTSGAIVDVLGQDMSVTGRVMKSPELAFRIIPGCDGTEGFAMFWAAVLASPFTLRSRLIFALIGTVALFVVNTFRIVTLFMIGVYFPATFHSVHMDLWPGFIIFSVLVCWLTWARWMVGRQSATPHEPG